MTRRSLRPQLNQIRTWVRQGRTDAWIAHQLEVTVQQIQGFKRENGLVPGVNGEAAGDFDDEIDLRAEDDALIAKALEEEAERSAAEAERSAAEAERASADDADAGGEGDADASPAARRRRRGRRGGGRARRGSARSTIEGTFDHGEEGYGLWLDPAVKDDPTYAEHWAGHRPIEVTIEENEIVIRRAGDDAGDEDED